MSRRMEVEALGIASEGKGFGAGSAARAEMKQAAASRPEAAARRTKRVPLPAVPSPALLQTMRIRAPPDQQQSAPLRGCGFKARITKPCNAHPQVIALFFF